MLENANPRRRGTKVRRIIALALAAMLMASLTLPAAAESDLSAAYAAYAGVLRENETAIRQYWQGGGMSTDDGYMASVDPRAIALADIMGDDVPELIFIARSDPFSAALCIYTCEGGEAKLLSFHDKWDTYGGSSGVTCVYLTEGSRELYGATAGNYDGFYHWASEDGVTLQEDSLVRMYDGDDPMSFQNGQPVENSLYDAQIGSYPQTAETLLIYTTYNTIYGTSYWDGRELISALDMEPTAMTYDEAMALFGGAAQAPAEDAAAPAETEVEIIAIEAVSAAPVGEAERSASDESGTAVLDIPLEVVDLELVYFFGPRESQSICIHADGSFDFSNADITGAGNGGSGTYTGRLDRMEQVSAHVYELHIADAQTVSTETYGDVDTWDSQPFRAGETYALVLPGANEGELNGSIVSSLAQMEMYGPEGFYDSAYYYIGSVNDGGEMWYLPYEPMIFE